MKASEQVVLSVISDFATNVRGMARPTLSMDTHLFQEGLVDSFGIVELTAELEKALGVTLPGGELLPEDFETPRALLERLNALE